MRILLGFGDSRSAEQNEYKYIFQKKEFKEKTTIDKLQADTSKRITELQSLKELKDKEQKERLTNIKISKDTEIANANKQIKQNESEISKLQKENNDIQMKILNTDVGTFKFVAKNFGLELDKTVNWFIILIISVFDPLAVTLLLCFNHIVKVKHEDKKITPVVEEQTVTPIQPPVTTTPLTTKLQESEPVKDNHIHFYEHDENGKIAYKPFKPSQSKEIPLDQAST